MNTSPDSRPLLDPAAAAALSSYWRVEVVDESPSTNAAVAERARAGEADGLVLVAERQTAGRGRLDRSWESPARAGLTFSILVRPPLDAARWPWLPLLTGLAVSAGVRRISGLTGVSVKWPNDVLVDQAKLAGILLERIDTPGGAAAVLGVGINVSTTASELPVPTATSLALAGADVDRLELLGIVLDEIAGVYESWLTAGGEVGHGLRDAYLAECGTVGEVVSVTMPDGGSLTGRVTGIDVSGRLEVETDQGRVAVGAGDVVHVR